jgi:hypothetical protein
MMAKHQFKEEKSRISRMGREVRERDTHPAIDEARG